jgi:hypothetical protein
LKLVEIENLDLYAEAQNRKEIHGGYIPEVRNPQKSRLLAERERGSPVRTYLMRASPLNRTCIRDMGRVKQVGKLHSRKKFIPPRVSFISHQPGEYPYKYDTGSKEKRNPLLPTGSTFGKLNMMIILGITGILSGGLSEIHPKQASINLCVCSVLMELQIERNN